MESEVFPCTGFSKTWSSFRTESCSVEAMSAGIAGQSLSRLHNNVRKSMDAQLLRILLVASTVSSAGASYHTTNFTVIAPKAKIAQQVGVAAERYRQELAVEWLGRELPPWHRPCPVRVKVGSMGAGGWTKFSFDRGEVFNWNMRIQGSLERIIDSVLPHEICHTIFACHFRRPLPRWADEGAATLYEHESERSRQTAMLQRVMREGRRIPLRILFAMKEYPREMRRVLTLYAQGYSLAEFLVQQGGCRRYLQFLADADRLGWEQAIRRNYRHRNIEQLERRWQGWFLSGSPRLDAPAQSEQMLAGADLKTESSIRPAGSRIRLQSPDGEGDGTRWRVLEPGDILAPRSTGRLPSPPDRLRPAVPTVFHPQFTGDYEFQKPVFPGRTSNRIWPGPATGQFPASQQSLRIDRTELHTFSP